MIQLSSRGRRNAPVKKIRIEVHDDGGDEEQGGPVVDLAHHQPGPGVEAEVEGRPVGLAHVHAPQGGVAAVVGDDAARWG